MFGGGNGERDPWKAAASYGGGGGDHPPQRPTITLPQRPTITLPQMPTITLPQMPTITLPQMPTITLPPRNYMETLFHGGLSPGPMTLVPSFFADGGGDDFRPFSQLLPGAMASPLAGSTGLQFDSPASFFSPDSFFQPVQAQHPYPLALSQYTTQASSHGFQSSIHVQPQHSFYAPTSFAHAPYAAAPFCYTNQHLMPPIPDLPGYSLPEPEYSHPEPTTLEPNSSSNVDKPTDDGYNWRKYGQKQVKGSEFPRSYYKCTHAGCPVKKQVERSLDGHVMAIIYKGKHNHEPPHRSNKRWKDAVDWNDGLSVQGNVDSGHHHEGRSEESSEATGEQVWGTSDSEEVGDREAQVDERVVEPDPKRRNTEVAHSDPDSSHRTVTEPRIMVQTTSEVDLLDDGYRWRKYGQKVVKGSAYPRSYYKCRTQGCKVRKHVERVSTDPKAVLTTYEGRHNHDVPAAKTNSHTTANNSAQQMLRPQNNTPEMHSFGSRGIGGNEQQQ